MVEIDKYVQCFRIALLSSAFNESNFSSNYVVIVTTISHWAICMSLFGLCQQTPHSDQLHTLFSSHRMLLFFVRHGIPRQGFSYDALPLNVCCVSHANVKPSEILCICVCEYESCKFLNVCMCLFGNASLLRWSNLRLKITNDGDNLKCQS